MVAKAHLESDTSVTMTNGKFIVGCLAAAAAGAAVAYYVTISTLPYCCTTGNNRNGTSLNQTGNPCNPCSGSGCACQYPDN
jgi:hypothetical protein